MLVTELSVLTLQSALILWGCRSFKWRVVTVVVIERLHLYWNGFDLHNLARMLVIMRAASIVVVGHHHQATLLLLHKQIRLRGYILQHYELPISICYVFLRRRRHEALLVPARTAMTIALNKGRSTIDEVRSIQDTLFHWALDKGWATRLHKVS